MFILLTHIIVITSVDTPHVAQCENSPIIHPVGITQIKVRKGNAVCLISRSEKCVLLQRNKLKEHENFSFCRCLFAIKLYLECDYGLITLQNRNNTLACISYVIVVLYPNISLIL